MRYIVLIFSLVWSGFTSAAISYDFHHHFTLAGMMFPVIGGKSRETLVKLQDAANVQKSMLISDSYRMKYVSSQDKRHEFQQELVQFLALNPDRFLGICSLDVTWPDADSFAKDCTSASGIRGVKIHFSKDSLTLQDAKIYAQFEKVLTALGDRPIFYLIHFDFREGSLPEAAKIFELASTFQKQNFIIAHGAERYSEVLGHIGQRFKERPELRHNVYTEISTIFSIANFFADDPQKVTANWRTFGINHIMFGSDFPISTPAITLKNLEASGLTPDEIEGIKTTHAQEFFDSLVR